ncbi:MAG: EscU/YscU/HrcU family type III secretion system export apparatus switch protein, partial [Chlamydiia bacterium]|nr:EscU/YscU/HrcU family type III secretion system export apparatus switch protein [Chlamydiia bacterium]
AKSQDLPSAFTFIASIWTVMAMVPILYENLGGFLVGTFKKVTDDNLLMTIPSLYVQAPEIIFRSSIPVLMVAASIGVIITFLTVGPVFATEVFKFDIKKFDVVSNLKNKFKMKTLVELIKSVLKITIAAYIIYTVISGSVPVLIRTVSLPITGALIVFSWFLMDVVVKVGLFFIAVAVFDFAYQKMSFANEMKMEKFEVKQEYKNTEGDPQIKGKRKQIAQEIAYSEGSSGAVKKAKAVITNPTHLAVAVGYRRDIDPAPFVLLKGQARLAEKIVRIAEQNEIPVVRSVRLAHTLFEKGEIYDYVPEETYAALAEILRWVAALNTEDEYSYEERAEMLG